MDHVHEEPRPAPEAGDLRDRATAWMRENPDAMAYFERFALEAASSSANGRPRQFGIKFLAERVRWEIYLQRSADFKFKINNNHVAYIARELVRRQPHLRDHLHFRKTRKSAAASQQTDTTPVPAVA